ncbi:hypothetical protein D3C76_944990 [compost metagenome]
MHVLPRLHVGQLGLLEIGDHIGLRKRHHREDFAPRRDIGTDPSGALADHTVLRCNDACVGQLVAGHFQRRLRPLQSSFRRVTLSGEDFHLLALRRQHRRHVSQPRGGLIDSGPRLLGVLHRAGAHSGEMVVAIQFMLGEGHFSLGRHDRGLGLSDHRSLTFKGRTGILQLRPGHQGFSVCCLSGGTQITVINQRQQLPGLDLLVVLHQHFLDEPGHARHHQREVRRDKGVIGVLLCAFAEQAGRQQIHQHPKRHHRGDANGHFLL